MLRERFFEIYTLTFDEILVARLRSGIHVLDQCERQLFGELNETHIGVRHSQNLHYAT